MQKRNEFRGGPLQGTACGQIENSWLPRHALPACGRVKKLLSKLWTRVCAVEFFDGLRSIARTNGRLANTEFLFSTNTRLSAQVKENEERAVGWRVFILRATGSDEISCYFIRSSTRSSLRIALAERRASRSNLFLALPVVSAAAIGAVRLRGCD